MHNLPKTKCLCGNDTDFHNLLKLSKNKPSEKDKKLAEDRLINLMKKNAVYATSQMSKNCSILK